jgi:hypothetical protein
MKQSVVSEEMLNAAMDAFYPGEDWRKDLGIALDASLKDMRAALETAIDIMIKEQSNYASSL